MGFPGVWAEAGEEARIAAANAHAIALMIESFACRNSIGSLSRLKPGRCLAQCDRRDHLQISRFSSRTGSLRMRWPVAWKIALQTAALVPTLASSPRPLTPAGLT